MKITGPAFILLALFAGLAIQPRTSMTTADDYRELWARVDSLEGRGLPRSAWDVVERIISRARDDQNEPQLLKALMHRSKYVAALEEDEINQIVRDLTAEVDGLSVEGRSVLHSILAELYWRYYQARRYELMDQTAAVGLDEADIKTWDARQLVREAVREYGRSLARSDALKATSVDRFSALLEIKGRDRRLRPTLYDFLAFRALEVFQNSETGLAEPREPFPFEDPRYMGTAEGFAGMEITSPDTLSTEYLAIRLYQDLVRFHLGDADPDALVAVDLARLAFVRSSSRVADRDSAYTARLREMQQRYEGHPAGTSVTHALASVLASEGHRYDPLTSDRFKWRMKQAHELCSEALRRFPNSFGADQCAALQASIEEKSAQFTVEDVVAPSRPFKVRLAYRNVEKVHFAVVRVSMEEMLGAPFQYGEEREKLVAEIIGRDRAISGVFDLPGDGDYQGHSTELLLPSISTGLYALLVGSHPEFREEGQARGIVFFAVSELGLLERRDPGPSMQVRVVERESGKPVGQAKVVLWDTEYSDRVRRPKRVGSFLTNAEGLAELVNLNGGSFFVTVERGRDRLVSHDWRHRWGREPRSTARNVTRFFTDRAIYRPGQTLYFKGILLRQEGERHEIRPGARTTVSLLDPNRRELAALDLRANEYGTVSGSFEVPTGAGTGRMLIRDSNGAQDFSVEEYKRPRFEVTFDPLEGEVELGQQVTVKGSARAFTGVPVDGSEVRYRVTRTPVFRPWQYWWSIYPPQPEAEIAAGVASTDENGEFTVTFAARPGDEVPAESNPVFRYRVRADVTDLAGETRSGSIAVRVGYTSLFLGVETPEYWEREAAVALKIISENADGTHTPARGRVVVSRLEPPGSLLRERMWARVDRPVISRRDHNRLFPMDPYANEDDPSSREVAEEVLDASFDTKTSAAVPLEGLEQWRPGVYRVEAYATDARGREVRTERRVTLFSSKAKAPPMPTLDWFVPLTVAGEPGEKARLLVGTSAEAVTAFVEVEKRGVITERRRLSLSNAQQLLEFPIEEEDRGNFAVHVSFVRHERAIVHTQTVTVPYTNKQLTLKLETFRDQLYPGQDEEWRLRIAGAQGEPVAAELLAAMYDASLDQFVGHGWQLDLYQQRYARLGWLAASMWATHGSAISGLGWNRSVSARQRSYDQLNWFGLDRYIGGYWMRSIVTKAMGAPEAAMMRADMADAVMEAGAPAEDEAEPAAAEEPEAPPVEGGPVRTNFNETAFFFPDLRTDENGGVSFSFTIPEALTRWRMLGLAHTTDLRVGTVEASTVTRKDLMITANAPRFFREGDRLRFAASVQSLADDTLKGTARLELFELESMRRLDNLFENTDPEAVFTLAPGRTQGLRWSIRVPEGVDAVVYRVVADAGTQSDGEQKPVPVLTNRMLVTETLPLPVRGPGTYPFSFDRLRDNKSSTLRHHALTLEYSSNPVWYAVQALPYMMEFPYECSEQIFSRLYANSIATHIVAQNPRIKSVFETWQELEAGALQSNLEKNQELKAIVIEETPWLLAARDEAERKRRIAVLFDFARMANEREASIRKLLQAQHGTGAWPWFDGMPPNRYITQHIVAGFGHLARLGIFDSKTDPDLATALSRAIAYLDREIKADYDELVRRAVDLDERHLGWVQIHYLYTRGYFADSPIPSESLQAFEYYMDQARRYWLDFPLYAEGMIALGLHRWGDTDVPDAIVRSLAENASHSQELGMYWKFNRGYFWYQAPVETQSLLIEAFDEIADDAASVADMQLWLLKQKQTQDWKTTKATTEAVYALLMRGTNLIDEDSYVTVRVGNESIDSRTVADAEAGTGYFAVSWPGAEVAPAMADVEVTKVGPGPAWGALYWQYFEQLDRITPADTPLSLEKKLFREEITAEGPRLRPLDDISNLKPGDRITVRIVIRVDRDMEYVHLKDMRAAGFEPVNVLSGYRYKAGLHYYESTRDAATHFFIGYLPKGTYVFEYPLRVNLAGDFSNGITSIQSMYAPEFASHSEGVRVEVVD